MCKEYRMSNASFHVAIQNGILKSIKRPQDPYEVRYIHKNGGFGNVKLTVESEAENYTWEPFLSGTYKDCEPVCSGNRILYEGEADRDGISVHVIYCLSEKSLCQEITVRNTGNTKIKLSDFGLQFFPQTDFGWAKDAKKEVLGHYFIGGSGSHATYYRCDGKGGILAVLPSQGCEWIWYDEPQAAGGEETAKRTPVTEVYALNASASRAAVEAGSRLRIAPASKKLRPGETYVTGTTFFFSDDYESCKERLIQEGQPVAESIPGYTVAKDMDVRLCVRSLVDGLSITAEDADVKETRVKDGIYLYTLQFHRQGEHTVRMSYGEGAYTELYYFVTEPVKTLLRKRAAFIANKQIRDEKKWYNGLLAEWNNESSVMLSPDNYDEIRGWRIYAVTCDDPGLSKPAFLSLKQTVLPVQKEVDALDYYIDKFVWGGLQQTDDEPYPYGIYGIPDWNNLRNSKEEGLKGKRHLWRIYDYPHIALMYYNMYDVAAYNTGVQTRLEPSVYLLRAYGTALAMFTIPEELEGWSALKTGLYNELVIPDIVRALKREGYTLESERLLNLWKRKVRFFVNESKDVFGSEYPFDTTGFESTHVLAKDGLRMASLEAGGRFSDVIPIDRAVDFMETQISCNMACRGILEPAYFWYGSDYRGGNMHYTLTYMSQMGGCALLDYACYYAKQPFEILRLAYGSVLSSWALMNTGDETSGYGSNFPGKENDGAASGGFEPLSRGKTWLGQEHTGGAWKYSCEIDLGFCGGIRGAATVLAEDPLFGRICYGGKIKEKANGFSIRSIDGVRRRFHVIEPNRKLHLELMHGRFSEVCSIEIDNDYCVITIHLDLSGCKCDVEMKAFFDGYGGYSVHTESSRCLHSIIDGIETYISVPKGSKYIKLIKNG